MTDTLVQEQLITADEFARMPDIRNAELVRGRVVHMPPAGPEHGQTDSDLHLLLGAHVKKNRLGRLFLNRGFILAEPNTVRGPDQAFVSTERIAANPPPSQGFWRMVPDLAVEIISPSERAGDVAEKVEEYLAAGVRMIWLIFPQRQRVHVHRPDKPLRVLSGVDVLDGEEIVPGFTVPVVELWSSE